MSVHSHSLTQQPLPRAPDGYIAVPSPAPPQDESVLGLCTKATLLGNNISVRMLEFLTTVKNRPHGLSKLAHEFLDICRVLWSIEAGLQECARTHSRFPTDMIKELDGRFRQTIADFQSLDQMLFKFLEYEKRGAVGKIQKGWRMMFADKDIDKMRISLGKTRDALRMSSLVFQWSLGTRTDASIGIGYAGLAAALDRMSKGRSIVGLSPSKSFEVDSSVGLEDTVIPPIPALPPVSLVESSSASDELVIQEAQNHVKLLPEIRSHTSISNISVGETTTRERERERERDRAIHSTNGSIRRGAPTNDDTVSVVMHESDAWIEEFENLDLGMGNNKVLRLKADPLTQPRWTPRNTPGANAGTLKTALVSAVQGRKHKLIEQVLDRGVSPDQGLEIHVLREAILNHDTETTRLLLLFGADVNRPDADGATALFSAIHVSYPDGAKMLLKYGADPNLAAGPESESPLAVAVVQGKVAFVQLLLIYGGDPNRSLANGNTLLIQCIGKATQRKLVDLMLDYGANPNGKTRDGKSALFEAISVGRHDIVASLLDHGANPNLPGPKHMLWPAVSQPKCLRILLNRGADPKKAPGVMELATSTNSLEAIRILLKAGVDPNAKKDGVWTPLCTSIRDDRPDIFNLLITNGADPNLASAEFPCFKCVTHFRAQYLPLLVEAGADLNSPPGILETAVEFNNLECFNWLLDRGINPNIKSPEGHTPLTTAIRENRMEMLEKLLARGADPNVRGQEWPICMAVKQPAILKRLLACISDPRSFKGVMEMAVVAHQLESIKLLLAAGVSVEDKNGGVFSPLTTAIREDSKEIVKFLLNEGGADPNAVGEHLPIVKAVRRCRGDDTEIIEMLLAHGADVNKTYRGWNAVMQAVENGDGKVLRLLAKKGVDLEQKDDAGRTVMSIAVGRGWEEAIQVLAANGKTNGPMRR